MENVECTRTARDSQEQRKSSPLVIRSLRHKVEDELTEICTDIINILDNHLLPNAKTTEGQVFLYKMKGDYHRYMAEFQGGDKTQDATDNALAAYEKAEQAAASLATTNPIRLGLALNFSVFYFEIMHSAEKACSIAKHAFDDAIAELDNLSEDSYKDSTVIMQLLRDNLTLRSLALAAAQRWWTDRKLLKRNAQERLDTQLMYYLSSFYKNFPAKYGTSLQAREMLRKQLPEEEFLELSEVEQAQERDYFDMREQIFKQLDVQVRHLFEHVVSIGGMNPYPRPVYRKNEAREKEDQVAEWINKRMNINDVELFNPGNEIEHPAGFKLVVRKSNLDHPESGYGVFLKGIALPGTVIALYPGMIYFADTVPPEVLQDNDYMFSRYDSVIIDGRQWDRLSEKMQMKSKQMEYAAGLAMSGDFMKRFRNPFGIGNYINHPHKDKQPNVFCYSFDFPDDTPQEFVPYIPNMYDKPPSFMWRKLDCVMPSAVIVARRPIMDEELFLNYRYNPANPYPDWYGQPDEEEAVRRWSKMSPFQL